MVTYDAASLACSVAYIGPGAGFAFLGSFLIIFAAVGLALISILFFPLRVVINVIRGWRRHGKPMAGRVVVLGLDGMDPQRVRDLMKSGDMPSFSSLAASGTFSELQSTCPPMSPVAWSSFATGVNPGKHNIFDFLNRDLRTCLPELSSSRISTSKRRGLFAGLKTHISLLRKSRTFWSILGEHGVFSTILRVPITFPPEKFSGLCLSAMCVPDIRGTQGAFTFYAESASISGDSEGMVIEVQKHGETIRSHLPGPTIDGKQCREPIRITINPAGKTATLSISGQKIRLAEGVYSDWISVKFKKGLFGIRGICKFLLLSAGPGFKLYVTPVNLDPAAPAMPISQPNYYSVYLSKLHGPFATLGLAEDTWALSEGIISDRQFLEQTYSIHAEREAMFFESLKRTRKGVCCCVFDLADRIQHMFFRYADKGHPAPLGDIAPGETDPITKAYKEMDRLLERTMKQIRKDDLLIVMSDHGFASFRRNVNINRWLKDEGYLVLKEGASNRDYLLDVDWARTRAYCFGLSGLYINMKGREEHGIVAPAECEALKQEIMGKLDLLRDPSTGQNAISRTYNSTRIYSGPYSGNGPDIIVGYQSGYRVSWDSAKGRVSGELFSDNTKAWSGDHCIDTSLVPGILLSNRKFASQNGRPHIMDVAPTILEVFGIPKPPHMDGKSLFNAVEASA